MTSSPSGRPLLERARPFLREDLHDRPLDGGILDALGEEFLPTTGQRALDSPAMAGAYEVFREKILPRLTGQSHRREIELAIETLGLRSGDAVVDLACGQGNFSTGFARTVGLDGLVIGIDIARAQLERAVRRRARTGAGNLLLIRGDALALPLRTGRLETLYCSGGLHQFPDLDQAMAEIARVCSPGARVAMSGFARPSVGDSTTRRLFQHYGMDVISLEGLGQTLERLGFEDYGWRMGPFSIGHAWARKQTR